MEFSDLSLRNLTNEELMERVAKGYYSEEALPYAKEELKRRGVETPVPTETKEHKTFNERHPVLTTISVIAFISYVGYKTYNRYFIDHATGNPNYKSVMEK